MVSDMLILCRSWNVIQRAWVQNTYYSSFSLLIIFGPEEPKTWKSSKAKYTRETSNSLISLYIIWLQHPNIKSKISISNSAKSWLIGKDSDAGRDWGQDRGWDGWMASLTRWTWVWVNSGSWWWTGRPGVLQFKGSRRVGHDWSTELNWTELALLQSSTLLWN